MTEKSFLFDNKRERKIYELYLNTKGADVNFVFDADTDHPEKVPAHKIILSLDSPAFNTMFFGSLPEQADVPIVDAPVAAFKEFLQFFYLNEVRLSSSNIVHVTNLCKKYEMNEFLKPCETAFQKSLTMDDICWGYGIAQLLEQDNLRKFCAEKIKRNAATVVKSESFLECDSKLLSKMLALVSSHWSTLEIVIACMEWSKAKCNHISLDLSSKNLRDQLKDVFCQIPFDKLTTQQISQHVATYKGFFTGEELETLFIQTSLPEQSNPFDLQLLQDNLTNQQAGQVLVCDRRKVRNEHYNPYERPSSTTIFSSNATILIFKFSISNIGSNCDYKIYESVDANSLDKLVLEGYSEKCDIVLPKNIVIDVGKFYRINVRCHTTHSSRVYQDTCSLVNEVQMGHGIIIKFSTQIPSLFGPIQSVQDKMEQLFFYKNI